MVDEFGRLMDENFGFVKPETKGGRLKFKTPPEGEGDPVERDLAVEVFRHHAEMPPAAIVKIAPEEIDFVDGNPTNCAVSNLVYRPGKKEEIENNLSQGDIDFKDAPAGAIDPDNINAKTFDSGAETDTETKAAGNNPPITELTTSDELDLGDKGIRPDGAKIIEADTPTRADTLDEFSEADGNGIDLIDTPEADGNGIDLIDTPEADGNGIDLIDTPEADDVLDNRDSFDETDGRIPTSTAAVDVKETPDNIESVQDSDAPAEEKKETVSPRKPRSRSTKK